MGVRLEPVGPLPASTYWRRRAVLLGALLVLMILLAKACGGGGGEDVPESLQPTPTPTASTSAPATTAPPTSAPPTPTPTPPTAPICAVASGLQVRAAVDRRSYPLGSTARLSLTITNTGTGPCRIGVGQGSLEFRVLSGKDRIWSSDDCSPGGPAGVTVLTAGDRQAAQLSWSLTRSAPGCTGRAAVRPGTYLLVARTGSVTSPAVSFTVT